MPVVVGTDCAFTMAVRDLSLPWTNDAPRDRARPVRQGCQRWRRLWLATRTPAEMLGLADQIGTVEVGKRADLMIVRDDPLTDLGALRTIMWTIKDGVAHTP